MVSRPPNRVIPLSKTPNSHRDDLYNRPMPQEPNRKQVSLIVYDNEPTARMAEQRLDLEGIPCMVKPLGGGPGLWGTTYNLSHDLLVYEGDETRARETLEIPLQEITERERIERFAGEPGEKAAQVMSQWLIILTIVVLAIFIAFTVVIADRIIR